MAMTDLNALVLEKVSPEVVYESLVLMGAKSSGTVDEQVGRLVDLFGGPGGENVQCDKCLGWSSPDPRLKRCPFCGEADEPTQIAAAPPTPETPMKKKEEERTTRQPAKPAPAILPETVAASPAAQTAKLDAAVFEIKELLRSWGGVSWDVCRKLATIYETDIWKARRNEAGEVLYKNFEAFTRAEFDMGRKNAQDLIKVAGRYTRAEVTAYGMSKLRLVASAPEEQQDELLEKIKDGISKKDLAQEVRDASSSVPTGQDPHRDRAKKGAKTRTKTGTAAPKSSAILPSGAITVAVVEGKKIAKLFAKPTGKNPTDEPLRPATALADIPWGHLDLSNDVRMFFTLIAEPKSGELTMRFDFRRQK